MIILKHSISKFTIIAVSGGTDTWYKNYTYYSAWNRPTFPVKSSVTEKSLLQIGRLEVKHYFVKLFYMLISPRMNSSQSKSGLLIILVIKINHSERLFMFMILLFRFKIHGSKGSYCEPHRVTWVWKPPWYDKE